MDPPDRDSLVSTRRRLLLGAGSVVSVATAGCGLVTDSDRSSGGEGDDDSTEADHHGDATEADRHEHQNEHELGEPESDIEVAMVSDDGYHFLPHVIHLEQGGTVTWVRGSGSHDTASYHPGSHGEQQRIPGEADPWASELLADDGDTFERTFQTEGVYDYTCTPHEGEGMVGSVVVGWPAPDDQPGLEPPSVEIPDAAVEQLETFNDQVRDVLESEEHGHDDHEDH